MKPTTPLAIALSLICSTAVSGDYSSDLEALASGSIREWTTDPVVVSALRTQSRAHADLSEEDILAMDRTWREETLSGGPLIDTVMANALSQHLRGLQASGQGRFSEIFATDARGLNAGQSAITSDYWQGDEDKWQVPHRTGAPHIGEIEFDESSQRYQSQISVPVFDGGVFIGVIVAGVDIEQLEASQ